MTLIKFLSSLLVAMALYSQAPIPGSFRSTFELVPGAATNVTDTHNVSVVRTSGTVLTIGNGASATAPQTIRAAGPGTGEMFTRQVTSSLTLTSAIGGGTGTIYIYGLPTTGPGTSITSLQIVVISNLGGTLNCAGSITCTVVRNGTPLANMAKLNGVYLAAANMTAGAPATFDVGGIATQGQGLNAWVKAITITNISASPVTVNIADGKGTLYLSGGLIQPNIAYEVPIGAPAIAQDNGLVFMERGLQVFPSAASAINVIVRWVQPRPVFNPAQP